MSKTLKSSEITELPEQLGLQFDVNTDGGKDAKYKQSQIFENHKKEVKKRKGMTKAEKLKRDMKDASASQSHSQARQTRMYKEGKLT